jgi:hypothetical protein
MKEPHLLVCLRSIFCNKNGNSSCKKCRQDAPVSQPCILKGLNKSFPIILAHTCGKLGPVMCNMTHMRTVLNPNKTVVVVIKYISHKPSLIGYQHLSDKCSTIDVLLKKLLTSCTGFIQGGPRKSSPPPVCTCPCDILSLALVIFSLFNFFNLWRYRL